MSMQLLCPGYVVKTTYGTCISSDLMFVTRVASRMVVVLVAAVAQGQERLLVRGTKPFAPAETFRAANYKIIIAQS